jgi:copper chaperone
VNVEINAKTVTVESEASEESIKQVIVAAGGYAGEGYRSDFSFSQKKFRL